ncbi:hypothetical protein FOZ60_013284 [Perkinsus olseni]|uniref:Uncharacterized protein n=1 Tax=Perkinsus olseni TaxID=32597 RepID=A0A7J6N9G7_PEROL|nr:hypothetical protein FOZ60_013284 [Perkinsus olseni]
MAPGSCNCNSILSVIGCIGAKAILPMKLTSLSDYPQLHDKLFTSIRQGIRERTFTPCQKMPIRPVSETLSYVLGAKRQQIRLCEDREMTAEEEANFECNVLDVSRIIAPINYVTEYHFPAWREDPLEAVNAKLRSITCDDSVRTSTIAMFKENVECGKRGQSTWLQCNGTFEAGQEIFRQPRGWATAAHCCNEETGNAALFPGSMQLLTAAPGPPVSSS